MKFQLSFLAFCIFFNNGYADEVGQAMCSSDKSFLYAVGGGLQFENREFPLPSPNSEQEETTCSLLSTRLNYKNHRLGIQKQGKFFEEYCTRRCIHSVQFFESIACGIRRSPPDYSPVVEWTTRTYNCSNLAFPMSKQDEGDDVFVMKYLKKTDPNTGFPNDTLRYLSNFHIKGVSVTATRSNISKTQFIGFLKSALNFLPTTTVVSLRVQNYFKDYSTRTENVVIPEVLPLIKQFAKLEEIIVQGLNISGWDQPHGDLTNIRGVSLENVFMKDVPEWIERCPKLNYLRIKNMLDDSSNTAPLDNLPQLEHFELEKTEMTTIKKNFLANSPNLISLFLTCNMINKIEEGALDHFENLMFLTIRKNRITSLPSGLLMSLKNLISFDIYGLGPISSSSESSFLVGCESEGVQSAFTSQKEVCIDVMPEFPYPEKIIGLEISQCSNLTPSLRQGYLASFPNLEHLRLSDSNLTGFENMSLGSLCSLKSFLFGHNALSDEDWLTEDFFVNNQLEITQSKKLSTQAKYMFTKASPSLLAMLKENSKFSFDMYSSATVISNYLNQDVGICEIEIIKYAAEFGYKILNETCAAEGQKRIESVKQLEERRLNDNKCIRE